MAKRFNRRQTRKRFEIRNMHIFAEGPTELKYIEGEKPKLRGSGWSIKPHKELNGATPKLVKDTIEYISKNNGEFEPGDEIYLLFDYDINLASSENANTRLKTSMKIVKEYNKKLDSAVKIIPILSNDAFELWPVLHFQDLNRYTARGELNELLSAHLKHKYKKASSTLHDELESHGNQDEAIKRARELDARNGANNPSTEVFKLIEKIRERANKR